MENHDVSSRGVSEGVEPGGWEAPKKGDEQIAVDATGFGTKTYVRWRDPRPRRLKRRDWLKLHAAVTSILKAIPSMEVTDGEASDSLQLKKLLEALPLQDVEAVAADSAYLSRRNCDLIEDIGAKPYIKPKRNSTARSHGSKAWRNMILDYRENPEEWKRKYHIRSSAETAFSVIKRRFGYRLSSIRKDLQRKELMTKVIAYNLNILAKTVIWRQSRRIYIFIEKENIVIIA